MIFIFLKSAKSYSKIFFRFINCKRIIETKKHQKIKDILNEAYNHLF